MTKSSFPLRFSPDQISIPHLVTMQFSHYYEVARWALDASAVTYREIAYALDCHAQPVGALKLIATTDHPVHTQEKKPASILDG